MRPGICANALVLALLALAGGALPAGEALTAVRAVIPLEVRAPADSAGGLVAADVNDDGQWELVVTAPGYLGVYRTDGRRLWSRRGAICVGGEAETVGLPGHHAPGVQVGDLDSNGRSEVIFLDLHSRLHVLDGADGRELWSVALSPPAGAEKWEHVVVANFQGRGERDLLLQATNAQGYRLGRYLAAHAAATLRAGREEPLWRRDDFLACAHNGARVADLDGDGRDEVLGACILSPTGDLLVKPPVQGHVDSVFVADVRPDRPGLEVVMLEEGPLNRVFLLSRDRLLWEAHHQHQEPQNAALGRFLTDVPGLQIWCRSRYQEHQRPFLFDAFGKVRGEYQMDDVAPPGWTPRGVEVIHTIRWTGAEPDLACAKERHKSGDVCLFEPASGVFRLRLPEQADRLYVADITGDWREEIVVWSGQELHLYANPQPNPHPARPRLWTLPDYRRSKMTWNYYSP